MSRNVLPFAPALFTRRDLGPPRHLAVLATICMAITTLVPTPLNAGTITFLAAASDHSASATFSLSGQTLEITLGNTYSNGVDFQFGPTDVLSGLFFDIAGTPALNAVKATMSSQSVLRLNGANITASETGDQPWGVGDVGAAWAYKSGVMAGVSQRYLLTAVGFSIAGPHDLFHPGSKLPHQQGSAPSGDDYGLMPLLTTNYSQSNFAERAFIQGSVTFMLSGFIGSLDDISNVRFQYGSALTSPFLDVAPEPSMFALSVVAVAAVLPCARRRWHGSE
ncbi:MAG: hypothetical protein LLG00_07345 [Planctomycetaceae bacterium]|nr:hypothetical protein [Planctomycetaceae bacterium]